MVINFFGRRGCGKTTTIRGNLKYMRRPVVIIDILGNYDDEEFFQTENLQECIDAISECVDSDYQKKQVIVLKTSDPTLAADYIAASIWKAEGGTLVLDEVDSIRISDGSCFDQYIRYGRNHNGDLITGCRRPAELDKNITAAADKFYCYQTHEIRDIEYFEACIFGDKAMELAHMEDYSGIFMDYKSKTQGKFKIDISGNIYHTEVMRIGNS